MRIPALDIQRPKISDYVIRVSHQEPLYQLRVTVILCPVVDEQQD